MPDAAALLELARSEAPLDRQRDALGEFLCGCGLSEPTVEGVLARTRDAIVLVHDAAAEGASRIGGRPLLPVDESWPREPDGDPLRFIAAIDLDELPALEPLPGGLLLIYWDEQSFLRDVDDFVAGTRVFHVPSGGAVEQAEPPGDAEPFEPLPLTGFLMPVAGELEHVAVPDGDSEALYAAADALLGLSEHHQLLGSSRDIQGPVLDEVGRWLPEAYPDTQARFSETELRGEGWLLLAQFEEAGDLNFGDAGALYLVMPQEDLAACRFDRVMGIMQCH